MIGLDTNVLVRLLTADEPAQFKVARELIEAHRNEPDAFYIDDLVLVETYWVLSRRYALERAEILSAFQSLASSLVYAVEDRSRVHAAIRLARERKGDFADALIALRHLDAGCAHTVTFDARLARMEGVSRLGD